MYCVGLTGAIASGKSTVAALFAQLGVEVISADHIARELTAAGQPALADIVARFGKTILNEDETLNRAALRDIIFQSSEARYWLEQRLHPLIRQRIQQAIQTCTTPYTIIEIPLLTRKADYPYLNRLLWITTEETQQIQRVVARDNCSIQQVMAILDSQAHPEAYRELADDILINNHGIADLQQNVEFLHQKYSDYAKRNRGIGVLR
jgi:dephospho-CoA kinase